MSVQGLSANSTNSARFFPISKGEKGTPYKNGIIRLLQTQEYADVKISISEDAQRLCTLMRTEDVEAVALKRYEEFLALSDQLANASDVDFLNASGVFDELVKSYIDTNNLLRVYGHVSQLYSDKNDIFGVYGYAARLYNEIADGIRSDTNDADNLISIANKYGELFRNIEERYSGDELEKQRAYLSAAFDLTVGIYGKERAARVERTLMFESLKIRSHNHWRNTHFGSTIFDMGAIAISDKDMSSISATVKSGFGISISHYAELIKKFVLENGFVTSEQGKDALADYLADTELPKGSFTLDEMHSISEVLKTVRNHGRKTTLFHRLNDFFSER